MATASFKPAPPVVKPLDTVVLEMTQDEALTLLATVGKITGNWETTYRVHTDSIFTTLRKLFPVPQYDRIVGNLEAAELPKQESVAPVRQYVIETLPRYDPQWCRSQNRNTKGVYTDFFEAEKLARAEEEDMRQPYRVVQI